MEEHERTLIAVLEGVIAYWAQSVEERMQVYYQIPPHHFESQARRVSDAGWELYKARQAKEAVIQQLQEGG